jgi:hypothetical protein
LAIWLMDWRSGAGLSAALIGYERQREWLEGLAKYVELEILRQAFVTADYQPVPALGDDPEFEGYGGFESRWAREVDQIRRMAGDEGWPGTMVAPPSLYGLTIQSTPGKTVVAWPGPDPVDVNRRRNSRGAIGKASGQDVPQD